MPNYILPCDKTYEYYKVECERCKGVGELPPESCFACSGRGTQKEATCCFFYANCRICKGTGIYTDCRCNGTGQQLAGRMVDKPPNPPSYNSIPEVDTEPTGQIVSCYACHGSTYHDRWRNVGCGSACSGGLYSYCSGYHTEWYREECTDCSGTGTIVV